MVPWVGVAAVVGLDVGLPVARVVGVARGVVGAVGLPVAPVAGVARGVVGAVGCAVLAGLPAVGVVPVSVPVDRLPCVDPALPGSVPFVAGFVLLIPGR